MDSQTLGASSRGDGPGGNFKAGAGTFAGDQRVPLREPQGESVIAMVVRFVGNRAAKEDPE